ncbi:Emopamil binding protein-domain-containing protein, partial [Aspergillus taichungensis]
HTSYSSIFTDNSVDESLPESTKMSTLPPHRYYPPSAPLPHFAENETSVISLIGQFGLLWAAVLGLALITIRRVRPTAPISDQLAFVWMCLKYSLSDSRYLLSDSFLVTMEAVTAFAWGPLAFTIAYSIATQHPIRHALQLILSVGQVYGDVLYYATSLFELYFHGGDFCRPEGYYFWFYYFFFNAIWMVIGSYYAGQSAVEITRAFRLLGELTKGKKGE